MKIVFKLATIGLGICLSIVIIVSEAVSQTKSGEEINWQVLSNGGTRGISTNYILHTTIGQLAGNRGTSTNYIVYHGYWQNFIEEFICDCQPGECNELPPIDILDIVHLIDWKFKGCPPGQPIGTCPPPAPYATCSGDADCNCIMDILDIVLMIDWKFKECPPGAGQGTCPPPCSCEEWVAACGTPIYK